MSHTDNRASKIGQQNINAQVYNIYGEKKIKKYIGNIPNYPELFIGRNEALKEVKNRLFQPKQNILLLVNGDGGIGKTTLAAEYYYTYQGEYEHIVWLLAGKSLIEALLSLERPLGVVPPKEYDENQRLGYLLSFMKELKRPCLLIIDNANNVEQLEKYHNALLTCPNFHVLLTTRARPDFKNTELFEVQPLKELDALKVFKEHYPKHDTAEDQLFFDIFNAVSQNTLVVELLAKNLKELNNRFKKRYTLDRLLSDINNSLLSLSQSKEVTVFYQTQNGVTRKETPENIIAAMYELGNLSDKEKRVLSNFAVLPAETVTFDFLEQFLVPQKDESVEFLFSLMEQFKDNPDILNNILQEANINQTELEQLLQQQKTSAFEDLDQVIEDLYQKGWIDFDEEKETFKVSPVIQEVVKLKNKHRLIEDTQPMISQLENLFQDNNFNAPLPYLQLTKAVVDNFGKTNPTTLKLAFDLSKREKAIGNSFIALSCSY